MEKKKIWLNHFEAVENTAIKIKKQYYSNGVCYIAVIGGKDIYFGYSNGSFWASTEDTPITGAVKQRCKALWNRRNL